MFTRAKFAILARRLYVIIYSVLYSAIFLLMHLSFVWLAYEQLNMADSFDICSYCFHLAAVMAFLVQVSNDTGWPF